MKRKTAYRTSIPDNILNEEHEPITFEEFIMPALKFDMKAYRKRLAKEKKERKRIREMRKLKKC